MVVDDYMISYQRRDKGKCYVSLTDIGLFYLTNKITLFCLSECFIFVDRPVLCATALIEHEKDY
jgi:hypothetical protein